MPRTIAALEALAGVGREPNVRVVVAAAVEQERGDALDVAAVDLLAVHDRTLSDMQHADDDGGQSRAT